MQLVSARVEKFKSVQDSTEFKVDRLTCLVGKNESGKSAILEALYKLNPDVKEEADFDVVLEYPRQEMTDYQAAVKSGSQQHANVLTTKWELEQPELDAVMEVLGPNALRGTRIEVTKGYDNRKYWTIPVDETAALAHVVEGADLNQKEAASVSKATSVEGLIATLEGLATPTGRLPTLLATLKARFKRGTASEAVIDVLAPYLPKFLIFASYSRLPGKVSIQDLNSRKESGDLEFEDRVFEALLAQADTKAEDLQGIAQFEPFIAKLEAISSQISRQIFRYWSQNRNLKVRFYFGKGRSGDSAPFNEANDVFRTRIENTRYDVTVDFDERSTGFVWFFSFLIWFSQVRQNYGERVVILLDEPGLTLHGKAQADLLRYFKDELLPKHQVIYTTHSPFMIDPENLLGARTVEDVVKEDKKTGEPELLGTKVGGDVLSTDRDTLFPLQAALGYDITQTMFVGPDTLLVEGPSDLLYLKWFQRQLKKRGRTFLDPRWTIAPVGGVDKVHTFAALLGGNQLHIAALIDYATGSKRKVEELLKKNLLRSRHVLTADQYADQAEADTEDLIGREMYLALVASCFKLTKKNQLPAKKPADAPERVVVEVQDHMRVLPPPVPDFDHYELSVHLNEHSDDSEKLAGLDTALDRFEKLFTDLNALL